jgi:GGDEF domain-containing protein
VSLSSNSTARLLVFPNGLLVVACLCTLAVTPALDAKLMPALQVGCAIVLAGSALLAVRLRSLRVFLGTMTLAALLAVLALVAIDIRLLGFVAALAAIDFALLLLVEDSFFDWQAVMWWCGLLFVQWTIFNAAIRWDAALFLNLAGNRITLPIFSFGIAELLFAMAVIALVGRFIYASDAVGSGLLWGLLALVPALRGSPMTVACIFLSGVVLAVAAVERSHWIAYHDELTGLPGRRAFNEALAALGDRYAIAIVDVDHFKKFNDTFGHDVGDQVLRKVAAQLSRVGGGGVAFRCGGEEFALVFADAAIEDAFGNAEEVRMNIEEDGFIARGPSRSQREREDRRSGPRRRLQPRAVETNVTVSIGIAEGSGMLSTLDVVEAADKALYRAKHLGRNRVERALPPSVRTRRRPAVAKEQPATHS